MKKLRVAAEMLCLILALLILGELGKNVSVAAPLASGICGEHLTWNIIDAQDGSVLAISGSGEMYDYDSNANTPWKSWKSKIRKVVLESGVSSIGNYAFYDFSELADVTLSSDLVRIGERAFSQCKNLPRLNMPDSIQSVGAFAFHGCEKLESIHLSNKLNQISPYMFYNCYALLTVDIPESVTAIGERAFYSCTLLDHITIPSKVSQINSMTFMNCSRLKNFSIKGTMTSIGSFAFSHCYSLIDFVVPEGVVYLGNNAFESCTSLREIALPTSLTTIQQSVFSSNDCLTDIYYQGTEDEWDHVDINEVNGPLSHSVTYNGNGDVIRIVVPSVKVHYESSVPIILPKYSIEVIDSEFRGGGVSPNGVVNVKQGESVTITYHPADGYVVTSVIVDGISIEISNNYRYTFADIKKDHVIELKAANFVGVEEMYLSDSRLTMHPGETKTLVAQIYPYNATYQTATWSSSNPSVAIVDANGLVTAKAIGEAKIIAVSKGEEVQRECHIVVASEDELLLEESDDEEEIIDEEDASTRGTIPSPAAPASASSVIDNAYTATLDCQWYEKNGKYYWYENGVRQGTETDTKCFLYDGTIRGREIYDKESDGWYWLDANANGAKAVGKEVFMPYIYQDEDFWSEEDINANAAASDADAENNLENADLAAQIKDAIHNKTGKWVRYDENGKMLKGWVEIRDELAQLYPEQEGNIYYYDRKTGLMAKGNVTINGKNYHFDETTGVLQE